MPAGSAEPGERRLVRYRGVWAVYWRDGRGQPRRVSLGTPDRQEAERRYRDWESDIRRQRPLTTVGEIVTAYLADRQARGTRSAAAMELMWRQAQPAFGHLRPHHIDRDICRSYARERMAAGQSSATVRQRLAIMRAALRWHDPATPAAIEMPAPPPPRDRHLTREEAARLIQAAAGTPHIHTFAVLALTTAARATALLELRWEQVDFGRGLIDLGGGAANKRRARPPINDSARRVLVAAREAAETDYVIEYAGRAVASVKKAFARACARAAITGVSPHTLRHTAAVWMAEAGVPMSEISQYLGHTSTRVTEQVYARYSPRYLRGAAASLELPASPPAGASGHKVTKLRASKSL